MVVLNQGIFVALNTDSISLQVIFSFLLNKCQIQIMNCFTFSIACKYKNTFIRKNFQIDILNFSLLLHYVLEFKYYPCLLKHDDT